MAADTTQYTDLITSEFDTKPKFMAMVAGVCQPFADLKELLQSLPQLHDLDVAVGDQLDALGVWVGVSRNVNTPLSGVYFSFDTTGLGFDEGTWLGPLDPTSGLTILPDDAYRSLIKVKIVSNQWDGTTTQAIAIYNQLFAGQQELAILDGQDMTFTMLLLGDVVDALTFALLINGYLDLRPAGVRIRNYYTKSLPGPVFGFDLDNGYFAGFDSGAWALRTPANS